MSPQIPEPDPVHLIPPFLACLPTSLVSPRPPPPLLPLLSPILKQKVDVFTTLSSSSPDPWIKYLCWGESNAAALQRIIEESTFEPHPVSGEIEVPEHLSVCYRKVDEETLRARLSLSPDYNLAIIYVWCTGIAEDGGAAWKVTELLPGDCPQATSGTWSSSIQQAFAEYEKSREVPQETKSQLKPSSQVVHGTAAQNNGHLVEGGPKEEEEDDDDDYWAMYDNNGSETPPQPAPDSTARKEIAGLADSGYYDQYDNVQPALDVDDPSINRNDLGESSLNGDLLASMLKQHAELFKREEEEKEEEEKGKETAPQQTEPANEQQRVLFPHTKTPKTKADEDTSRINHPRPSISSNGSSSSAISKLEETAETHWAAENAVKQHVSISIRSLFRLAKSTGMSTPEFKTFINEEMEGLRSDSE
ncbi:hypothetical protein KEM56_003573 [Ascosphaera pollenicola]|nr:hypothetical protein KEM56_003573 [Ascosphaera pollenicola]